MIIPRKSLSHGRFLVLAIALFVTAVALLPNNADATFSVERLEKRLRRADHPIPLPRQLFGGGSSSSSSDDDNDDDSSSTRATSTTRASTSTTSRAVQTPAPTATSSDSQQAAQSSADAAADASASLSSVAAAASASAAQEASRSAASASASEAADDAAAASSSQAARSSSLEAAAASSAAAAAASSSLAHTSARHSLSTSTDAAGSIVVITSVVQASATAAATASAASDDDDKGSRVGLIAGVAGGVGGLALLGGLAYLLMRFTGKRSGFDDGDADIKWPELKHAEGDVAAMQPLPARRTGGAGFDMGEDAYSDTAHGSRLDDDEDTRDARAMTMADVGGAGGVYGDHLATAAGAYGGSSVHLTGAGAYGAGGGYSGNPMEYASHGDDYGAAPDYMSSHGDDNRAGYYDDYSPGASAGGADGRQSLVRATASYTGGLVEPDLTSPHAFMNGYDDGGYGIAAATAGTTARHDEDGDVDDDRGSGPPHLTGPHGAGSNGAESLSSPRMEAQSYLSRQDSYQQHFQHQAYGQYQQQQDYRQHQHHPDGFSSGGGYR